jgi:hypothetical protein
MHDELQEFTPQHATSHVPEGWSRITVSSGSTHTASSFENLALSAPQYVVLLARVETPLVALSR